MDDSTNPADKKAANGTGNIRQKANGRWEARWTEAGRSGPRRRSAYGATEREARLRMAYERGQWINEDDDEAEDPRSGG